MCKQKLISHVLQIVWFTTASLPEKCTVPFLPVNPQLSSTRNQGRQKLARFTQKEFTTLIVDLLVEAGRRHTLASNALKSILILNLIIKTRAHVLFYKIIE